ncbi:MAG: hypothetical protein EBU97_04965, partial [Rhodobacteraceae bacterium]|nr:hypothetical protein [Paracoccaceae bacterium]
MVVGLALIYILIARPVYQATTLLLVDSSGSNILDPQSQDQQQSAILNSVVDSEVEILRSDATALAVVKQANLINDPEFGPQLGWFEKAMMALGVNSGGVGMQQALGLGTGAATDEQSLVENTVRRLQSSVDVRRRGLTYLIAISVSSGDATKATMIANTYAQTYLQRQVAAKTNSTLQARDVLRRQIETAQSDLS